ncbi:hypothetical protein [Microvirga yunnanensis]|uniref:hypothetical protein n=1 Tax=Microvirga yunnanensis TaxID=2953740 RepID=UPI0021C72BBB|nr:hypothetical protein [Microvirga sp. HBU65207]
MMSIVISGPAVEPVTREDMKTHLGADGVDGPQDDLIAGLVKAPRFTESGSPGRAR